MATKTISRGQFTRRAAPSRSSGPFFRQAPSAAPRENRRESPSEPPPLSEESTAVYFSALSAAHKTTVRRLIQGEIRRLGYNQVREGGVVWEKAKRSVISNLMRHEVDLDEIFFDEPQSKVREHG